MSAPLIWIALPLLAGLVFWILRRDLGRVVFLSVGLCLLLALLAWLFPPGETVRIGPLAVRIDTTLFFFGRRFIIDSSDRVFLIFIFSLCAFWFGGSFAAGANNLLVPLGFGVVSLLVAALAVEPFLYAALLVEMAVLMSVPLLAPPGTRIGQGVLRFLIFQTLAMPFILLAGWALAGVEVNPSNLTLVTLSTVFLGLGFAFWLAVFPFYTWIPLLAEQTNPYVSGFIFMVFPTVDLLLGLNFFNRFGWLHASPQVFQVIGQVGILMIVTAGVWAAFQQDLARLLGYGVIVETGYSLLAIGLGGQVGGRLFSSMFLPRMIGLGLWALSLAILRREAGSTHFDQIRGWGQRLPFASAGLAVAALSLGGLPLFPVFPIHQVLLEELARQSLFNALWAMIGSGGMIFSAFRALSVLIRGSRPDQPFCESRLQIALLLSGIAGLLLIGFLPQVFLPMLSGLSSAYTFAP